MMDRVKYAVRQIKPLARISSQRETIKDALGPQSIKMRDDADHHALQKAGVVWQRHQKERRQRWLDWTETLGLALVKVREEAMAIACTNKPKGKRYAQAVSGLLKTYHLDEIDAATRSHAIDIMQNLEAVTDWRAKQKNPDRLNHPTTVWRSFASSDEWRISQVGCGIKSKERRSSARPKKKQLEALPAALDTTQTGYERIDDARELEAKALTASAPTKEGDDGGIPGFLDRTPRRALTTLLAGGTLTLQDVPSDATSAALAKLARNFSDLADAMKECKTFEAVDAPCGRRMHHA